MSKRKKRGRQRWKDRANNIREQAASSPGTTHTAEASQAKTNHSPPRAGPKNGRSQHQNTVKKLQPTPYVHKGDDASEIFAALTTETTPGGSEAQRFGAYLRDHGWEIDSLGNARLLIAQADGQASTTGFCAHMDDVSGEVKKLTQVIHFIGEKRWMSCREKSILGADDKAGMSVLLYLIDQGVPGAYHLFVEEESGMIGSRHAAAQGWGQGLKRMIAFDRRGKDSVITRQRGQSCCSAAFAETLCEALHQQGLNYTPDPTGSFTDSAAFTHIISECTNLSVGYEGAHGHNERQDLDHLNALAQACAKIDWEALPAARQPGQQDARSSYAASTSVKKQRKEIKKVTEAPQAQDRKIHQSVDELLGQALTKIQGSPKGQESNILRALWAPNSAQKPSASHQMLQLTQLLDLKAYETLAQILMTAGLKDMQSDYMEVRTAIQLNSDLGALSRHLSTMTEESIEELFLELIKTAEKRILTQKAVRGLLIQRASTYMVGDQDLSSVPAAYLQVAYALLHTHNQTLEQAMSEAVKTSRSSLEAFLKQKRTRNSETAPSPQIHPTQVITHSTNETAQHR